MRAQVSVEYIILLGIVFLLLVPGVYFFYRYSFSSGSDVIGVQANRLGQEMINMAIKVRGQGVGSWLQLDENIPEAVEDINVSDSGSELVITYQTHEGESQAVFFPDQTFSLSNVAGFEQDGSVFALSPHAGKASFRFTAQEGYVAVTEVTG